MRTRPREVMRLLATLRHSAHCRALRAAAAQDAMRLAREEAEETVAKAEGDRSAEPEEIESRCDPPAQRRVH